MAQDSPLKNLVPCQCCGRLNWHENERCRWCFKKMPTKLSRWLDWTIITVMVVGIIATIIGIAITK